MSGREIDHKTATITAITTTGYVTIASVTGFYRGAVVWMNDSTATDANNKRAIITSVNTVTNQLGIRLQSNEPGSAPNLGNNNMTVYNGGTVTQHQQFIYDVSNGTI